MTITKTRFIELLIAEERLARLNAGGVDNWEWYSESINTPDKPSMDDFELSLEQMTDEEITTYA